MSSFAALAALTAIPVLGSILNTVISGKKQSPAYSKVRRAKKKKFHAHNQPIAKPAIRTGKGKGQFKTFDRTAPVKYHRNAESNVNRALLSEVRSRNNSGVQRLL